MQSSSTKSDRIVLQRRAVRRLALLIDGTLEIHRHKTAMGLLRYCPEDIVCVIDNDNAGSDVGDVLGIGQGIPIVAGVEEALKLEVDYIVIGVATPGGYLPPAVRDQVYKAIRSRIGVISGLHEGLTTDPNIASLACRHAVDLIDLRQAPLEHYHDIGTAKARGLDAMRVLTVGTDCNLGKMTTALNLEVFLRNKRRIKARFVATGQNGILIKGRGVCVDRVVSDFVSGAVERLLFEESSNMDMLIIEGQGSLLSPPFSAVTQGLVHGACPDAMVLCHRAGREMHRNTDVKIPSLKKYADLYESMAQPLHEHAKVVAVNINTEGFSEEEANKFLQDAEQETGLPAVDVVRQGRAASERLSDTILAYGRTIGKNIEPDMNWDRRPEKAALPIGYKK